MNEYLEKSINNQSILSPNPTSGEFGESPPHRLVPRGCTTQSGEDNLHLQQSLDRCIIHHPLASPHPSFRFGAVAFGQLCTLFELGRPRHCRGVEVGARMTVPLLCCCLELCPCRLELGRPVYGRGWELGRAHRTGPSFVPTCSSVASQSAGRELGH